MADVEFTSPVDPTTTVVLSKGWFDATGYAQWYERGIHPGHDLNNNTPVWNSDKGMPVYAIGDGVVTCSQQFPTWHWLIVIDHSNGTRTLMSRYAHVLSTAGKVLVKVGDKVKRGQQIAFIGNADGTQPDHLHVDLSPTDILKVKPNYWPTTEDDVHTYFIDMILFLLHQGQTEQPPMALTIKKLKNVVGDVINLRVAPETNNTTAPKIAQIPNNAIVSTRTEIQRVSNDGYEWVNISAVIEGKNVSGWAAAKPLQPADSKKWLTEDF